VKCPRCGQDYSERHYRDFHQHQCKGIQIQDSSSDGLEVLDNPTDRTGTNNTFYTESDPEEVFHETVQSHVLRMMKNQTMVEKRVVADDYTTDGTETESPDELINESDSDSDVSSDVGEIIRLCCAFIGHFQSENNMTENATSTLLKFLKTLFSRLNRTDIAAKFPSSIHKFEKVIDVKKDEFRNYVVCSGCHKLYEYDDCWCVVEGERRSKNCPHVPYPNHTQRQRRGPCGTPLLEVVNRDNGKLFLQPVVQYYYKSIRDTLEKMVAREKYEGLCNEWRSRDSAYFRDNGMMADIYDGRVWQRFEDTGFFDSNTSYGLILNIDWFNPYKHSTYSIGMLYMVNANLPRVERFKIENVFIVGIIPDMPHQPSTNTFVQPLVDELLESWRDGWLMCSHSSPNVQLNFRVALICVGADIPAARKLCGFLGHTANRGCSRCKKIFPGEPGNKNYGGFERDEEGAKKWIRRTNESHRDECEEILQMPTKTTRALKESEYGTRYSALLQLPYYQPIEMCTIDPMHNLYLGTSKHMIQVWKDTGRLTDEDFVKIQQIVDEMKVPSEMGKIPKKISSKFSKLTADEWKNWTLYFSIIALQDLLPKDDLECWRKFVVACKLYHSRVIRINSVIKADGMMLAFCKKFEKLYTTARVTPNMHLSCHLSDIVLDYGPIYAFWLYPFERYNGIMAATKTNKRNIEPQMLRKFLRDQSVQVFDLSVCEGPDCSLHCFLQERRNVAYQRGTLHDISKCDLTSKLMKIILMADRNQPIIDDWSVGLNFYSSAHQQHHFFNEDEFRSLSDMYHVLYGHFDEIVVSPSARSLKSIKFCGETLGSKKSRSSRSSNIRAFWPDPDGKICMEHDVTQTPWPGRVNFYILHAVMIHGEARLHLLANVEWYERAPENVRQSFGSSVEVWKNHLFLPIGASSFIPVQRINCKFIERSVKLFERWYVCVVSRNRFGF
jgi:hypothetical protein